MRKFVTYSSIIIGSLLFAACEGPQGPRGPEGPQGPPGESVPPDGWRVDVFTVYSSDWQLYGNPGEYGSYYYYIWEDETMTEWIFDLGLVSVYLFNEDDRGVVQRPLPDISFIQDDLGDFTQLFGYDISYDYDRGIGTVGVYVFYSDYQTKVRPADQTFRVVKEWWNE